MSVADADIDIKVSADGAGAAATALKQVSDSIDDTGKSGRRAAPGVKKHEKAVRGAAKESKDLAASAKAAESSIRSMGRAATYANVRLKALERTQKRLARAQAKSGALGLATGLGGGKKVPNGPSVPVPGLPSGGGGKKKPPKKMPKMGGGKGISGGVAGGAIIAMASRYGAIIYMISALIPALVTGIASLGAGIIGLAGSLAPLGGLLIAYPGYLMAVGQAFLGVKLSMAGMADGLKGLTDATMSWQESSQSLARFTGGGINKDVAKPLLKDITGLGVAFKYVGYQVQRTLVPGMRQALGVARGMIPMLSSALVQTGEALGGIMQQVAGYLGSARAQSLIQTILGTNTGIITTFGNAISEVLSMVLELVNAAGPMLSRMATDIGGFMSRLGGQVRGGAASGSLSKFFDSAYAAAKRVMAVIGPLFKALWNVMKIGKPLGDAILAVWARMANNFLMFTQSAGGIQKITGWFAYMKPILWEIGYLIRDISKVLGGWSMSPGFIEMSQMIRHDMLPVIEKFVTSTAQLMLPLMMEVATAVLKIITAWQSASVTFMVFKALAGYLSALAKIMENTDGIVSKVIATIFTFLLVLKVGAIAVKIFAVVTKIIVPLFQSIRIAAMYGAAGIKLFFLSIKSSLISTGIGALVVAVGFLLEALMMAGNAKDEEIAANKDWAKSIYDVNGALSAQATQITSTKLADAGYYKQAKKYGIGEGELLTAVLKRGDSLESVKQKLRDYAASQPLRVMTTGRGTVIKTMNDDALAALRFIDTLTEQDSAMGEAATAAEASAKALGIWGMTAEEAENKLNGLPTATATAIRGIDALTQATLRTVDAFQQLKGMLENIDYNVGLRDAGRSLGKMLKDNGKALGTGGKGDANRSAVAGIIRTYSERAQAFDTAGNTPAAVRAMQKGQSLLITTINDSLFGGKNRSKARDWARDLVGPKAWDKSQTLKGNLKTKAYREWQKANPSGGSYGTGGAGSTWIPGKPTYAQPGQGAIGGGYQGSTWVEGGTGDKIVTPLQANSSATTDNTAAIRDLIGVFGAGPTPTPGGAVPNSITPKGGVPNAISVGLNGMNLPNIDFSKPNLGLPTTTKTNVTLPGVQTAVSDLTMVKTLMTWITNNPVGTVVVPKNVPKDGVWSGGPVEAGWRGWVGELGPEGFLDKSGRMSIIGKNGPEVKTFASSGTVIPAHQLAGALATRESAARSGSGGSLDSGGVHVTIGDIHQATPFEVERAVLEGIRKAERERRERS